MSRPLTRSRASTSEDGAAVNDVTRFLQELTKKDPKLKQSESMYDSIQSAIEKQLRSGGNSKIKLPESFIIATENHLSSFLVQLLQNLVIASRHRAELNPSSIDGMTERDTSTEEWLLYKEDCATHFNRCMRDPTTAAAPPVYNKADYQSHASEEEQRMLITAQSVRRVGLRDLLTVKLPRRVEQKVIDSVAFQELCSEYRARGLASPAVGYSPSL